MSEERKEHLFTPYIWVGTRVRAHLMLNDEDYAKISRGERWQATVTDQLSGKQVEVRDADCGLPHCNCAAVILTVLN